MSTEESESYPDPASGMVAYLRNVFLLVLGILRGAFRILTCRAGLVGSIFLRRLRGCLAFFSLCRLARFVATLTKERVDVFFSLFRIKNLILFLKNPFFQKITF